MSVKGMMQTVLVTELKQIQPDISDAALKYVVASFSQIWDVREILAEEVSSLQESNQKVISKLENERDALAAQLTDVFGDGYYDGFLDGAKHHEQTDCNTDPNYLGDDALHCSEIAEQAKSKRIGVPSRLDIISERDALLANVNVLRKALRDQLNDCINFDSGNLTNAIMMNSSKLLAETPQQCLADIKAEAGEVAYYNGFKDALVIEPPLPSATGTSGAIDFFAYRIEQASRYAANQYAAKIRNTGTWLKDSNVNGGKRQGGE